MADNLPEKAQPLEVGERGLQLRTSTDYMQLAHTILRGGLAPKGMESPDKILLAIQHGAEIGMPPMQALQSIAVINGRPCLWGDALPALVRASGLCKYIKESFTGEGDDFAAVCEAARTDGEDVATQIFSVADAKVADVWGGKKSKTGGRSGPWKDYPKRMLQMRARAWCLRDLFPDVLRGLQVREEVEDYRSVNTNTRIAIAPVVENASTGEMGTLEIRPDRTITSLETPILDAETATSPTPEDSPDTDDPEPSDATDGNDGAMTDEEREAARQEEIKDSKQD